jgi:phosphoglycolate phosphatase-like HAD superfamily hydrolase
MGNRNIAIFDIDHTLCDATPRDHMLGNMSHYSWDDYHAAAKDDLPHDDTITLLNTLQSNGWYIVLLTTRPEKFERATMDWLYEHKVMADEMLMRPDGNFLTSPELKMTLVHHRFGADYADQIGLVFDNDERVIEAFKAAGVSALQVHCRRAK